MMDHSVVSSWKKAQVKDVHFHLFLPHSLLHGYSNPLTNFSGNAQGLVLLPATKAMMARVVSLTCSALLMIFHPASTLLTLTFSVNRSTHVAISITLS